MAVRKFIPQGKEVTDRISKGFNDMFNDGWGQELTLNNGTYRSRWALEDVVDPRTGLKSGTHRVVQWQQLRSNGSWANTKQPVVPDEVGGLSARPTNPRFIDSGTNFQLLSPSLPGQISDNRSRLPTSFPVTSGYPSGVSSMGSGFPKTSRSSSSPDLTFSDSGQETDLHEDPSQELTLQRGRRRRSKNGDWSTPASQFAATSLSYFSGLGGRTRQALPNFPSFGGTVAAFDSQRKASEPFVFVSPPSPVQPKKLDQTGGQETTDGQKSKEKQDS